MQQKLHLTFKAALKLFFKTFRWLYYLALLMLICILPLGISHDLLLITLGWLLLPLLFAFLLTISPSLIFKNKELIVYHTDTSYPKMTLIKYTQINYINIAKAPAEISVIYQLNNTTMRTIKIFPNDYNITFEEILSYFPANIPAIEKED